MGNRLNLEQIRSEARFYCYGAAAAINVQREKDQILQNQLDKTIVKSAILTELLMLSFSELSDFTANHIKDKIAAKGIQQDDLNNIGWELGLICYVWSNSLPVCKGNFTGIFIETWEKYFS